LFFLKIPGPHGVPRFPSIRIGRSSGNGKPAMLIHRPVFLKGI
jgi:hypothetical protein